MSDNTTPRVTKAVIPAAGLGTRFLPATKAVPKEMIPVIDKPAIQYVVEEAVGAGITDILIITGREKSDIENHFDRSPELERNLEAKGKTDLLEEVRAIANLANIHYIRQGEPLGLGHAVGMGAEHVGNEPFAVLLPDDLMVDESALLSRMVAVYEQHATSVISLKEVPMEEISAYGCPSFEPVSEGVVKVIDIVEKPAVEDAPSNLATTGRYVFGPEILDAIREVKPGHGGEIQLTDAIDAVARAQGVYGCVFVDGRYDMGKKPDFLRATVELALRREDLGTDFRSWLVDHLAIAD